MSTESSIIDYESYLNRNVKVFSKKNPDPVTGRIHAIRKNFITLIAKKANRQENKILYVTKSIRKENIEKISLI